MTSAAATGGRNASAAVAVAVAALVVGVATAVDLRLGAVLALVALAVPVALRDPPVAFAAWAAFTVYGQIPGFGLLANAIWLLALGALLAQMRANPARFRGVLRPHRTLLALLGLLLAWLALSLTWAEYPGESAQWLRDWLQLALSLIVLLVAIRRPRDAILLAAAVLSAVLVSAILGLAGVNVGPTDAALQPEMRLTGATGDANFMAAFIVAAIVLSIALRSVTGPTWRRWLPVVTLVLVAALMATESRGGLIAALVTVVAALAALPGRRLMILGVTLVTFAVAGAWVVSHPALLERIQAAEQDRGNGRQDLWTVAWRMTGDQPAIGVGLGNFTKRSGDYVRRPGGLQYVELITDRPHVAHNTYLGLLAETGVPGLLLFLAVWGTAIAAALSAARAFERRGEPRLGVFARAVFAGNLGLLTACFFISAGTTGTVWVLIGLGPVLLGVSQRGGDRSPVPDDRMDEVGRSLAYRSIVRTASSPPGERGR
jgi:O-antigen ligase